MGIYLRHPSSFAHDTGQHPECAARLTAIEAELGSRDWEGLELREPAPASAEQITRVHDPAHFERLRDFCAAGGGMIDMDTCAVEASWEAALRAAGAAVSAADAVLGPGGPSFAFCGMRPPGHHAERGRAMGFCLFNNVAVGAAHAIATGAADRVLILDWDVHHGNGTEQIFYEDPSVLYVSLHQSPLYPGTGAEGDRGAGAGEGYNINLPVAAGSGPEVFLAAVEHIVVPIAREFEPGLLAISAGYDAHAADPLADCRLETATYGEMAAALAALELPVIVCLEGGYDTGALAASVAATIDGLSGRVNPRAVGADAAAPLIAAHSRQWPVLG